MSQRSRTTSIESLLPFQAGVSVPFHPTRITHGPVQRSRTASTRAFTPRVVRPSGDKSFAQRRQSSSASTRPAPGSIRPRTTSTTTSVGSGAFVSTLGDLTAEPPRMPRAAYLDQSAFRALLIPDNGVDHLTSLPRESPIPSLISPNPQWTPLVSSSSTTRSPWATAVEGPWGASTLTAVTRGITSNFNSGIQPPARIAGLTATRPHTYSTRITSSVSSDEEESDDDRATPISVDVGQSYVQAAAYSNSPRIDIPGSAERREFDRLRAGQVSSIRTTTTNASEDDDMVPYGPEHDDRLLDSFARDDEREVDERLSRERLGSEEVPRFLTLTFQLPTRWSEHLGQPSLIVSEDGRKLSFHGNPPTSERNAAAARTSSPIHAACGIFYFEIEILTCGTKPQISIGLATKEVRMNRLPGWEANSWGYHADDGFSFHAERGGKHYGPIFNARDVIGCGIDFTTNRCFYTKNGAFLGLVFDGVGVNKPVYPAVGLRHPNESIRANFGQEPFKFQIEDYATERRIATWQDMLRKPVPSKWLKPKTGKSGVNATEDDFKGPLKEMVMSYLVHHGYGKTASALRGGEGKEGKDGGDAMRNKIKRDLVLGNVESAVSLTKVHFPQVLENVVLARRLDLRRFVEMVLCAAVLKKMHALPSSSGHGMAVDGADDAMDVDEGKSYDAAMGKAIAFGKTLNTAAAATGDADVQAAFTRTFGIIAYEDPLIVPEVADIVGQEARVVLAHELNEAILKSQGRPAHPLIEQVHQQASACQMQLGLMGVGAAAYMDIKELLAPDA